MPSSAARSKVLGLWLRRMLTASGQHERLDAFQILAHDSIARRAEGRAGLVIHADQIQALAGGFNRGVLKAQHPGPALGEEASDGVLHAGPALMIAQATENAKRRLESGQGFHHRALRGALPGDEVAGQRHQIRLQLIHHRHVFADVAQPA